MRNLTITIALLSVLLSANFGQTQELRKDDNNRNDNKEHSLPCRPERTVINAQGPTGKANLDRSDFFANFDPVVWNKLLDPATNQFNQTAINQAFAYTFHFPVGGKECCRCIEGATLTVTLKALQTGPAGSSTSSNDLIYIVSSLAPGNKVIGQVLWPHAATAGQTETLTFQIPCKYLTNGHISFYVEDDTAVTQAQLTLSRCCLLPEGK